MRRRDALVGGGVAASLLLGPAAWRALREPALVFEPHPAVPGFRRIAAGAASSGTLGRFDGLVGLAGPLDATREAALTAVLSDLCGALFGGPVPPGAVPVASFSDYNCPYCRVLTERLAAIEARSRSTVRVRWHELPLLGEASRTAARAALAAARQGAYPAMHARLMRSRFQLTPAYLDAVAEEIGLDPGRLRADMASPTTLAELRRSAALADVFGFPGTPVMVVGRTVVVGEIGESTLERLIARERADGPVPACAEHPRS